MKNTLVIASLFAVGQLMAIRTEPVDDKKLKHGEIKCTNDAGKVTMSDHYEHGNWVGPYREFFQNGKPKQEVVGQGDWALRKTFFDDGNLRSAASYRGGVQITSEWAPPQEGWVKEYFPEGGLRSEVQYRAGEKHGARKVFDENHRIKLKENFRYGKKESRFVYDDEGRVLNAEDYYDDGSRK